MRELDSVAARTAQAFTPTDVDDLPAILRRRLFTNAEDNPQRDCVARAYAAVQLRHNPSDIYAERTFRECYPFHPETIRIITERLANNSDFPEGARHPARPVRRYFIPKPSSRSRCSTRTIWMSTSLMWLTNW